MDGLKEVLEEWAGLKTLHDEALEEMTYKNTLATLRLGIKNGDANGVAELYQKAHTKLAAPDAEMASRYIVDELVRFLKHNSFEHAAPILAIVGELKNETFHRSKSVLADYIVRMSTGVADHSLKSYVSTMLALYARLDPPNNFRLSDFVKELCTERLGVFIDEGRAIVKKSQESAKKDDILRIDKWVERCVAFLALDNRPEASSLASLYEEVETYYFELCITHVILPDKNNGPDDLLFLVKKICGRAERCGNAQFKESIKQRAADTNIMQPHQAADALKI